MLRSNFSPAAALLAGLLLYGCAMTSKHSPDASARLTDQEWVVEDIAGDGIVDNTRPSLLFGPDGRLSGHASCNRLLGSYSVEGSKLTINGLGLTMMSCPPALMNQERRFVDVLNDVRRYRIDASGTLVLTSSTGATIIAR